jgi:hypothetical protein
MIEDGQHDGVRIGPPRRRESQSRSLTIPLSGAATYAEGPGAAPIREGRSGAWRKNTPAPSARTGSYQRSCISGGPTASSRWNFRRSGQNGSPRISSRCAGLRASTASRSGACFTSSALRREAVARGVNDNRASGAGPRGWCCQNPSPKKIERFCLSLAAIAFRSAKAAPTRSVATIFRIVSTSLRACQADDKPGGPERL